MKKFVEVFCIILEVVEWLEILLYVLCFWELKFYQFKLVKWVGGWCYYWFFDMEFLVGIKKLFYEDGVMICGVQKILCENGVKYVVVMCDWVIDGVEVDEVFVLVKVEVLMKVVILVQFVVLVLFVVEDVKIVVLCLVLVELFCIVFVLIFVVIVVEDDDGVDSGIDVMINIFVGFGDECLEVLSCVLMLFLDLLEVLCKGGVIRMLFVLLGFFVVLFWVVEIVCCIDLDELCLWVDRLVQFICVLCVLCDCIGVVLVVDVGW